MGFFSNLFKASEPKETKLLPWIALTDLRQLHDIKERSKIKTQVIFKHSTRCGASRMVLNQFVDAYALTEEDLDLYFLDLINYRDVSNEVGYMFQVMHESPQLLVIKNGVVVVHSSHGGVNTIDLNDFL
jgi:monothiol bacilliredoxin